MPPAAKSWRVTDFQDNITVANDGSAVVAERITLIFVGEWHGIHRTIPIEYPGPNGTNYELFLKVTSVTDGSGGKLKYESSTSNGARDLKIYIPDAVDATRTVEITYRGTQRHALLQGLRRVLLERHGQRLAGADRSRCRDGTLPGRCRGLAAGAGFYRRVWLDSARCEFQCRRRRGAV